MLRLADLVNLKGFLDLWLTSRLQSGLGRLRTERVKVLLQMLRTMSRVVRLGWLFGLGFAFASILGADEPKGPPPGAIPTDNSAGVYAYPQYLRISRDGKFQGYLTELLASGQRRFVPNFPVNLVSSGKIIARVLTGSDGQFVFSGVEPGPHTIVASDAKVLMVMPVMIGPSNGVESEPVLLMATSRIPRERRTSMTTAMGMSCSLGSAEGAHLWTEEDEAIASLVQTTRITLSPQGMLRGRLGTLGRPRADVDMRGMVVRIFRDGNIVGEALADELGSFHFSKLGSGRYDIVAFGPRGFAAVGIEAIESTEFVFTASTVHAGGFFEEAQQDEGGDDLKVAAFLELDVASPSDVCAGASVAGDSFTCLVECCLEPLGCCDPCAMMCCPAPAAAGGPGMGGVSGGNWGIFGAAAVVGGLIGGGDGGGGISVVTDGGGT